MNTFEFCSGKPLEVFLASLGPSQRGGLANIIMGIPIAWMYEQVSDTYCYKVMCCYSEIDRRTVARLRNLRSLHVQIYNSDNFPLDKHTRIKLVREILRKIRTLRTLNLEEVSVSLIIESDPESNHSHDSTWVANQSGITAAQKEAFQEELKAKLLDLA